METLRNFELTPLLLQRTAYIPGFRESGYQNIR
jgi:hypothetical protein